jgi:ketosteroid isomerase-like protein
MRRTLKQGDLCEYSSRRTPIPSAKVKLPEMKFPLRYPVARGRLAVVLFVYVVLTSQSACVQSGESEKQAAANEAAIRAVLEAQAAAWNRGDVGGYMDGYERAETTTLISGDSVTRGWQVVHDRYKKSYDTPEKMGTLAFSELEVKPLSEFYASVTGRWQLTRAGDTPHGRFALIFRRTNAGWRIVHDHTTSE